MSRAERVLMVLAAAALVVTLLPARGADCWRANDSKGGKAGGRCGSGSYSTWEDGGTKASTMLRISVFYARSRSSA